MKYLTIKLILYNEFGFLDYSGLEALVIRLLFSTSRTEMPIGGRGTFQGGCLGVSEAPSVLRSGVKSTFAPQIITENFLKIQLF